MINAKNEREKIGDFPEKINSAACKIKKLYIYYRKIFKTFTKLSLIGDANETLFLSFEQRVFF